MNVIALKPQCILANSGKGIAYDPNEFDEDDSDK